MRERVIVSAATLLFSLGAYYYAKDEQKDAVPFVMIGGFLGAFAGEVVADLTAKDKNEEATNG